MALLQKKEQISMILIKEVTDLIGIQEAEFMMSIETYAQNPAFGQYIQAAQSGKLKQT